MNTPTTPPAAHAGHKRKVSSVDRLLMYAMESWPLSMDRDWMRKMRGARLAAVQSALDPVLVKAAATMGIARLLRSADKFQAAVFEKLTRWVSAHEVSSSEVMKEMQYRIAEVGADFNLTEAEVTRAVVTGLVGYIDDGGSPEFAIRLADFMGIAEEKRCFLQLVVDL
jgi:hypothetical protein